MSDFGDLKGIWSVTRQKTMILGEIDFLDRAWRMLNFGNVEILSNVQAVLAEPPTPESASFFDITLSDELTNSYHMCITISYISPSDSDKIITRMYTSTLENFTAGEVPSYDDFTKIIYPNYNAFTLTRNTFNSGVGIQYSESEGYTNQVQYTAFLLPFSLEATCLIPRSSGSQFFMDYYTFFNALDDPWGPEGEDGGGDGDFDDTTEEVPLPELPEGFITSSGMVAYYEMNESQLKEFADFLWSRDFDIIADLRKLVSDPWDLIMGLSYFPIPASKLDKYRKEIVVGRINVTDVQADKITGQYVVINCGSVTLSEYSGGFYDYSPYTKVDIFLPFIGSVPLDVDDVMDATLEVEYIIDITNGSAVCSIHVSRGELSAVLYQFNTTVNSTVPLTSANYGQQLIALASVTKGVIGGAMSGGTSGAMVGFATSVASNIGAKPVYNKSNGNSGTAGIMGIMKPYLVITRPIIQQPANYNNFIGRPLNLSRKISEMNGFTKCSDVVVDNTSATTAEKEELRQILMDGFYA